MVHRFEDREGFAPRAPGGGRVAGFVVGVAEAVEGAGLVVPVPELAAKADRAFVARDRLCVVTGLLIDEAEAVPRGGLRFGVANFLLHRQRLAAGGDRIVVL